MKVNYVSASSLIFANLYPIYGVYFLGWGVPKIILLYFIESVLVAFYFLLKIYYIRYKNIINSFSNTNDLIGLSIWFSFWYIGTFAALHFLIFGNSNVYYQLSLEGIILLFISHGISFYTNFVKNFEYEKDLLGSLLVKIVFLRILPLHFLIVFLASILMDSVLGPVIISLFIVAKTALDLFFHILEHRRTNFYNVGQVAKQ